MSQSQVLYGLEDRPGFAISLTAAIQHVLASFIGVVTPTLIISSVLGLQAEVPYLISMALLATGLGTFIQTKGIGPVGSGLVAVQGTSFAFLSADVLPAAAKARLRRPRKLSQQRTREKCLYAHLRTSTQPT